MATSVSLHDILELYVVQGGDKVIACSLLGIWTQKKVKTCVTAAFLDLPSPQLYSSILLGDPANLA